jgi:hypothetical protein
MSVPPVTTTRAGSPLARSAGIKACNTSVTLPAVPMSNRYVPPVSLRGVNVNEAVRGSSPSVSAVQTSATARTAARCCGASPGLPRFARALTMRMAFPVTAESATAVRTSWPPPSP